LEYISSAGFEMSYAYSGRKMKFSEDFYAVTIVSYIYYEEEQKDSEAILEGNVNSDNIEPKKLDRDLLIADPETRREVFADAKNPTRPMKVAPGELAVNFRTSFFIFVIQMTLAKYSTNIMDSSISDNSDTV